MTPPEQPATIEAVPRRPGMLVLGQVSNGRDNNFNLIRFVAATAVLVSHAWPIALGPEATQPLKTLTGHTLGGLAVFVFFAVSGFFISASYARSRSAKVFVTARAARLFPGLIVSILLVALVMGPLVTDLPVTAYLTSSDTLSFIVRNITLAVPQYTLPGVFEDLPYPSVEGSIWTLIHEVLCYVLVFVAGLSGILSKPRAMGLALVGFWALWAAPMIVDFNLPARLWQTRELSLPFVIGMAFWLWRDRLTLSVWGVLVTVLAAALARDTQLGFVTLAIALTYTTFWCAYIPRGRIRGFNALGDYSYGMYIYAFPLQGLVVWLWGPMSPGMNIALSLPLTLICAVASWHWIERPMLEFARGRISVR